METKKAKYENLIDFVNASVEGFTATKASAGKNLPNKNTTIHICNGFVKAGLLSATKSKDGKVFTKMPEWDVQKAINANKARIRVKVEKRKLKQKPEPNEEKKQESKPKPVQKPKQKPKQESKTKDA
jgi:outer membrane biosynthesis protein TonB